MSDEVPAPGRGPHPAAHRHRSAPRRRTCSTASRATSSPASSSSARRPTRITMDCLGALGKTKVSLPCIAWSQDERRRHSRRLRGRPGRRGHARARAIPLRPPRLPAGPGAPRPPATASSAPTAPAPRASTASTSQPEPYDIVHHHGKRDAVPRPALARWASASPSPTCSCPRAGNAAGTRDPADRLGPARCWTTSPSRPPAAAWSP